MSLPRLTQYTATARALSRQFRRHKAQFVATGTDDALDRFRAGRVLRRLTRRRL